MDQTQTTMKDLVKLAESETGNVQTTVRTSVGDMTMDKTALGTAISASGCESRSTVKISTAEGCGEQNKVIQFSIDNSGVGAATQKLRIGSWAALTAAFTQFGLTAGAADNVVITDDFGASVQKVQGFSKMTISSDVIVEEIRVISSFTNQLTQQFSHKRILFDFTVIPIVTNIAYTEDKSDQRTDLLIAKGRWLLNGRQFLEFTSLLATTMTIQLLVTGSAEAKDFVQL